MKQREEVQWFAQVMESVLRKNDYNGGWHDDSFEFLLDKILFEEIKELKDAIECLMMGSIHGEASMVELIDNVVNESADIANLAMMIADKAVEYTPNEKGATQ